MRLIPGENIGGQLRRLFFLAFITLVCCIEISLLTPFTMLAPLVGYKSYGCCPTYTYWSLSLVLAVRNPLGKYLNWLLCKALPTKKNHNHSYYLHCNDLNWGSLSTNLSMSLHHKTLSLWMILPNVSEPHESYWTDHNRHNWFAASYIEILIHLPTCKYWISLSIILSEDWKLFFVAELNRSWSDVHAGSAVGLKIIFAMT